MSFKNVCILTKNYPDSWFVERGAFVERLVRVWSAQSVKVNVVAPRSIVNILRYATKMRYKEDVNIAGDKVLYPTYLSLSNKTLFNFDLKKISRNGFLKAAQKGVAKMPVADLYYGQFLLTGGLAALQAGKKNNRPSFADVGESVLIGSLNNKERKLAAKIVQSLDGIACVSEKLRSEVIELGADPDRVMAHPNTVDLERFFPMEQSACRKKLGLPQDQYIAIFVGHFIERKGPLRVLRALERVSDLKVKGVFIGRGEQKPQGKQVLYAGPVPNKDLSVWLNAADLFVLPTQSEGHCNAINEAMACGLPVISSDIPEVRSQVPDRAGILIDPMDVEAIANGFRELINHPEKRIQKGKYALEVQRKLSSKNRAMVILEWMEEIISLKNYPK